TNIIASGEHAYGAAVTYRNRADTYYYKHDYDLAIADYDQAIKLSPQPEAYYGRGKTFHSRGDFDRALSDFNIVRLLAYYGRGPAYYNKHDYERAIDDFERVLQLNPKYENAANALAAAKLNQQLNRGANKKLSL